MRILPSARPDLRKWAWIALFLFALHSAEEALFRSWQSDPFATVVSYELRIPAFSIFVSVQVVLYAFLVWLLFAPAAGRALRIGSALLAGILWLEMEHVILAMHAAAYVPGLITGIALVIYGIFLAYHLMIDYIDQRIPQMAARQRLKYNVAVFGGCVLLLYLALTAYVFVPDVPQPMEFWGLVTGAIAVILSIVQSTYAWPVSIVSNVSFAALFWQSGRPLDAIFRVLIVLIAFYGWSLWMKGGTAALGVRRLPSRTAVWIMASIAVTIALWVIPTNGPYRTPFSDAIAIVLAVAAQFLLAKKYVESWWALLVSDAFFAATYAASGFYQLAALSALTFVMCLMGLSRWRKALAAQSVSTSEQGLV